jgi:adenosine kinase
MPGTKIVICGSIAIDRIMNFGGRYRELVQPDKLHVLSLSVLLDKLEDSRGGIGANISSALAQLGEQPVLISSAGPEAADYLQDLAALGIDMSNVHVSQLPTASFNVLTDSEDSQVGGFYPGAMLDSDSVSFMPWQGQDALMLLSGFDPKAMNRMVGECRQANLRLVYDPGQQVSEDSMDLRAGVEAAEIVFLNDYEHGLLCKKTGLSPEDLKAKVPILITTFGKEGSIIEGHKISEAIKIPMVKADQVVDPTGAGDTYRAGFLYGYLRQWDLAKCGRLGATMASFIIERHGTQQEFSKAAIIDRYRRNFNEEINF